MLLIFLKEKKSLYPREKLPRSLIHVWIAFVYLNLSLKYYAFGYFYSLFKGLGVFRSS